MGFWTELKELGKGIGEDLLELKKDLKKIGYDTVREIKEDPSKYLIDSAKDVAKGAQKVGQFAVNDALPAYIKTVERISFEKLQEMESFYQSGRLSDEARNKYIETRNKSFETERRTLERLIKFSSEGRKSANRELIEKLNRSCERISWYLSIPNFISDPTIRDAAKDLIESAKAAALEFKNNT